MPKSSLVPDWQRALIVLTGTVMAVTIVVLLYWAKSLLIPIVLAIFLTFILAGPVTFLHRHGMHRTPAVILVVLLAASFLGGGIWLATSEISGLVGELPKYSANIARKIKTVRQMVHSYTADQMEKMVEEVGKELRPPAPSKTQDAIDKAAETPGSAQPAAVSKSEENGWLSWMPNLFSPLLDLLSGSALSLVLVVFMLVQREDLRNRLLRLVGHGRVTVTTKALDDAGRRISRFLFTQLVLNACYGLILGTALFCIGLEHAFLWGFLAGALRYLPYIGVWIAALPCLAASFAMFTGWQQPLLVLAAFLALELFAANVAEPRLYGRSIGVSEVGLLIVAAFWAFLWGPIGLLLSSPLTVCLVVLGKYVPQLEFLNVLLGDEPALPPEVVLYQRLLARDPDEATELVIARSNEGLESVYDGLLIPALTFATRDLEREHLSHADEQFLIRAMQEIIDDLGERRLVETQTSAAGGDASGAADVAAVPAPTRVRLIACPNRGELDALVLRMLGQLLDPAHWVVEILSVEMLSAEVVEAAGKTDAAVVCIGSLSPGGLARTRYLCKRLRARLPDARIVVGRWGHREKDDGAEARLLEAGADNVETTLAEARRDLDSWLPTFSMQAANRGEPVAS